MFSSNVSARCEQNKQSVSSRRFEALIFSSIFARISLSGVSSVMVMSTAFFGCCCGFGDTGHSDRGATFSFSLGALDGFGRAASFATASLCFFERMWLSYAFLVPNVFLFKHELLVLSPTSCYLLLLTYRHTAHCPLYGCCSCSVWVASARFCTIAHVNIYCPKFDIYWTVPCAFCWNCSLVTGGRSATLRFKL